MPHAPMKNQATYAISEEFNPYDRGRLKPLIYAREQGFSNHA